MVTNFLKAISMMAQENLFEKIQELLGTLNGKFNVLEEQIDIDLQIEYFELSKGIKKSLDRDETMNLSESLFSVDASLDQKKNLLSRLAAIDQVEAFRILERYRDNPDPELKDWSLLAVQESRMLIEGSLLEQNQVFVSTGLGGRGRKLRYFVVFLVKEEIPLSDFQKKILQSELMFVFKKHDVELENIEYTDFFVTVKLLIPIELHLSHLMDEALESCNQFGDFMQTNYIITNVRELSYENIQELIVKFRNPDAVDEMEVNGFEDDEDEEDMSDFDDDERPE